MFMSNFVHRQSTMWKSNRKITKYLTQQNKLDYKIVVYSNYKMKLLCLCFCILFRILLQKIMTHPFLLRRLEYTKDNGRPVYPIYGTCRTGWQNSALDWRKCYKTTLQITFILLILWNFVFQVLQFVVQAFNKNNSS